MEMNIPYGCDIVDMMNRKRYGFTSFVGHGSPSGVGVRDYRSDTPNDWRAQYSLVGNEALLFYRS